MRLLTVVTSAVLTAVLASFLAFAGPAVAADQDGGWGAHSRYQMFYRVTSMETVAGTVLSVNHVVPLEGMTYGISLKLKTAAETIDVHLGPGSFVEKLGRVKFRKKDKIEVRGSRVTINGQPVVIAAEVRKGETEIMLRDRNGIPAWAGRKR